MHYGCTWEVAKHSKSQLCDSINSLMVGNLPCASITWQTYIVHEPVLYPWHWITSATPTHYPPSQKKDARLSSRSITALFILVYTTSNFIALVLVLILMIFTVLLCYLSSNKRKVWKFQAWRGLEPWPLWCQYSAPPIELSGPTGSW